MPEIENFKRESARDLLKHAGWHDFLGDVSRTMKGERHKLLFPNTDDEAQKVVAATSAARGAIVSTKNLIHSVYLRAEVSVPEFVRNMFE